MLKTIRRTLAAVSLVAITLLFLDITGALHAWLGWIAKIQLLPAILALNFIVVASLLLLTLIFGRIYCSIICPLGIFQDLISDVSHSLYKLTKGRRVRYDYRPATNVLRVAFLAIFVVLMLAGFTSLAGLIEPYSAFGRLVTYLLSPIYDGVNNLLALVAERADSYAFYSVETWTNGSIPLIVAGITFLVILRFAAVDGRSYCNTICPVGTLLGFFSRYSYFKVRILPERCKNCGRCAQECKAHCIDYKHHTIDYSRCVVCGNCLKTCNFSALGYRGPVSRKNDMAQNFGSAMTNNQHPEDKGRRSFLLTAATITAGAAMAQAEKKVDGGLAVIEDKQIPRRKGRLVPQGAEGERHFYQHCTACQLCVSACPNGVLRPSTDLDHFMQPTMQFERGYCRPECNACSTVCPTGAIRLIDLAEKSSIKIGTARVNLDHCVTTAGTPCNNCAHHCPVGAITMVQLRPDDPTSPASPVVDTECCIGCGACEALCPVRPNSAIIVDGIEQHRNV